MSELAVTIRCHRLAIFVLVLTGFLSLLLFIFNYLLASFGGFATLSGPQITGVIFLDFSASFLVIFGIRETLLWYTQQPGAEHR